jgi:hypothetical protein
LVAFSNTARKIKTEKSNKEETQENHDEKVVHLLSEL